MTTITDFAVRARDLTAGYHGVPAITEVSLDVASGEMVALLGANGAGKTTTLRALIAQVKVLSGSVEILGHSGAMALHKRARAGLGLISERRSIFADLTCEQNLQLGRGTVSDALAYFPELERKLSLKAGLTSGGEQQMLVLARVLAGHPRLILADEVSLGLAPLMVERLLTALRESTKRGAAVLLVEQHPVVALDNVDRAYVLRRGRVVLEGTSADLRSRIREISDLYL
jgi:branched-chain amino acid transport system ATP-binding protein